MKTFLLIFCIAIIGFSCTSSSFIAKTGKNTKGLFPQLTYKNVIYFQHASTETKDLKFSTNMALVQELWVPDGFPDHTFNQVVEKGWIQKKTLTKKEIRKLRKIFSDQGREYFFKSECDPFVYDRCMVFLSESDEVVGTIYFCPKGYMIEARPTLRPEKGNSFFWSEEGGQAFTDFIEELYRQIN